MKIAMLFPVGVEPTLEAVVKDQVESCASPGTEIAIFSDAKKTLSYAGEIETRSVGALEHASYAEKNGFDAVIIGAM